MSYFFRPRKKIFTQGGEVKEQYFAVAKPSQLATIEDLAEDISRRSHLRPSTVLAVIMELSMSVNKRLFDGYNVNIEGIGTFGVAITSDGVDNPEDLKPKHVRFSKLTYRPDRKLVRSLKDMKYSNEPAPPKGCVTRQEFREAKERRKQEKLEEIEAKKKTKEIKRE